MLKQLKQRIHAALANSGKLASNQQGLTLTEMLIVIALIALVGTYVASNVMGKYNKARAESTRIQMKQLGVILDDFKRECGFYPTTDQGLEALIQKPGGGRDCKNYDPEGYIKDKKVPKDGFGNDFSYFSDGNKFTLKSLGGDGAEGGDGPNKDITSDDVE